MFRRFLRVNYQEPLTDVNNILQKKVIRNPVAMQPFVDVSPLHCFRHYFTNYVACRFSKHQIQLSPLGRIAVTILVAYVPRPEGQTALDKGIEIARRRNERLVVVNASLGGSNDDSSVADNRDVERVEQLLSEAGIDATFKQFFRGKSAAEEVEEMVDSLQVSLLIIGLRKRTPVGKLFLGSVAQELLLSVPCPVLSVKAK